MTPVEIQKYRNWCVDCDYAVIGNCLLCTVTVPPEPVAQLEECPRKEAKPK